MAISFHHHQTRCLVALTSGVGELVDELIDELPQTRERGQLNPRLVAQGLASRGCFIEHPAGNHDPQFRIVGVPIPMLNPDQAPRFRPVASAAQDRHLVVEERVKAINNPRRTELAGSVWIR
jgi:hypothetical protein